jgi:hypothetical protein
MPPQKKPTWKKTNFKEHSMKISKYFFTWSSFIRENIFLLFSNSSLYTAISKQEHEMHVTASIFTVREAVL